MSLESHRVLEVMEVLIGDIMPIGETYHDEAVLKNLETLLEVADSIITQLKEIKIDTDGRKEHSVEQCNLLVGDFLNKHGLYEWSE